MRGIRPIKTKTKKGKECKEKVKPLVQVKLQEGRNSSVKESENTGKDKKRRKQKLFPRPRCSTSLPNTSSARKGSW